MSVRQCGQTCHSAALVKRQVVIRCIYSVWTEHISVSVFFFFCVTYLLLLAISHLAATSSHQLLEKSCPASLRPQVQLLASQPPQHNGPPRVYRLLHRGPLWLASLRRTAACERPNCSVFRLGVWGCEAKRALALLGGASVQEAAAAAASDVCDTHRESPS